MEAYKVETAVLREQVRIYKDQVKDAHGVWEKRLETLETEAEDRHNAEALAQNRDALQSGQPTLAIEMDNAAWRTRVHGVLARWAPSSAVCTHAFILSSIS